MTAQPTERDRATAAEVLSATAEPENALSAFGSVVQTPRLIDAIALALAAEREAALRPVLALVEELRQFPGLFTPSYVADRIRAACSGQGDGADGPERPQDGPPAPDRPTDTTPAPERTAQGE